MEYPTSYLVIYIANQILLLDHTTISQVIDSVAAVNDFRSGITRLAARGAAMKY
jgi:hypothetical protein